MEFIVRTIPAAPRPGPTFTGSQPSRKGALTDGTPKQRRWSEPPLTRRELARVERNTLKRNEQRAAALERIQNPQNPPKTASFDDWVHHTQGHHQIFGTLKLHRVRNGMGGWCPLNETEATRLVTQYWNRMDRVFFPSWAIQKGYRIPRMTYLGYGREGENLHYHYTAQAPIALIKYVDFCHLANRMWGQISPHTDAKRSFMEIITRGARFYVANHKEQVLQCCHQERYTKNDLTRFLDDGLKKRLGAFSLTPNSNGRAI
mgnify:CR=1 FL=1